MFTFLKVLQLQYYQTALENVSLFFSVVTWITVEPMKKDFASWYKWKHKAKQGMGYHE